MATQTRRMDKQGIMVRVNQASKEAVGWYDSRLSKERQRVINYYNSQLPKRRSEGSSSYVSTDVYDSVEAMKAQIVETFSANPENLVSFPPLGPNDVEPARIATEYCNHVFFNENDGLGIINDTVHDGLTARIGVVKVFWDEQTEKIEETFDNIPYQNVQALVAHPEVSDLEANANDETDPNTTYSGKLTRTIDKSHVGVEVLAPEEFLIEPRTRKVERAGYSGHRTLKTKAELKRMGYDPKLVDSLHYDDDKGLDLSPEVLAREAPVESALALDNPVQPEVEKVMLYESYIRMDIDGTGVKLWKICHVTDVMLSEPEEVDRVPFKLFVPIPIPHTFFGNNFAHRVIPTQNARTVLTRGILDHTATTTNPRWTVLKGGLLNPREMLDNRQGGIVNITRPDAVEPLEQANLNPFVFQTLEMLKQNKEESTGISALSQGLNKDAISTQNSAALVDNLVTLSMQRQKIIARNFGKFLADVYLEIYRLVLENQDKEKKKIIQVAGEFIPVSVEDWVERNVCRTALHLGYGERDRQVAKYQALDAALRGRPLYTPQNEYKLLVDAMRAGGFENYASYVTNPAQLPPQQPDPKIIAEGKAADAKTLSAQAAMVSAQATAIKDAKQADVAEMREQIAELMGHMKMLLAARDEARKDAETANRIQISQREMNLAEEAAPGKETDVVAPRA